MATEEKNDKNITENFDKVNNYIAPTFNGGSGVGSKSNIEKLAEDYVNSNYTDFTKGSDYASLAKRYNNMGKQAMKDTLGQASARTGGYANSYAVGAGQQAQNSFMEKLEDAARGLYDSQMAEKANKLNVAQGIYDRNYSEFKDNRDFGYSVYRDSVGDSKWKDTMIYNAEQDAYESAESNLYQYIRWGGSYVNYDAYKEANSDSPLSVGDYNRIVQSATGEYNNDNIEGYEEDLATDFSFMTDEELNTIINGDGENADADANASQYIKYGIDAAGVKRIARQELQNREVAAKEQEAATAESAEQDLLTELMNGGEFNPSDTRIEESGKDPSYFYNQWKAGWKDTALSPEATMEAINSGKLTPNVLKSYEVHHEKSYCQEMLEDIMASEPEADNFAFSWRNPFFPSMKEADDGKKKDDMVELYATAWEDYDMYGFYNYIDGLPDDDPLKMIYSFSKGGSSSTELRIINSQMAVK